MAVMWKYQNLTYAYQTDDKTIADKMERREKFYLFNKGWNCNHWVFHVPKKNQRDALNTLKALTNKEPEYNSKSDVWESNKTKV